MKKLVDPIDSIEMNQVDYEYFEWLTSQVHIPNNKIYNDLFELMHNTEFVWTVPNDDNRVQDALDLRNDFTDLGRRKLQLAGATLLEVLISLSRRVAFTAGGDAEYWAWKLLKNLRLNRMVDPLTVAKANRVNEIFYSLIWRTYQRDGRGGFFPLKYTMEDQTKVEIWYQMNAYINEMQDL